MGTTQPIIEVMPSLLHTRIPLVHLPKPSYDTLTFVRIRLAAAIDHMFVFRSRVACHMTLVDAVDRVRVFSCVAPTTITATLRVAELFQRLTSLSIWEYVYAGDMKILFRQDVPALRRLTLFVYPAASAESGQTHIYEAGPQHGWVCRVLRSLHVTSRDLSRGELFPSASDGVASISARRLNAFVKSSDWQDSGLVVSCWTAWLSRRTAWHILKRWLTKLYCSFQPTVLLSVLATRGDAPLSGHLTSLHASTPLLSTSCTVNLPNLSG